MNRFAPFLVVMGFFALGLLVLPNASLAQDQPENLKLFPSDMSRDAVLAEMRHFTLAMNVRCTHCHTRKADGRGTDFVSDANPNKEKTRAMMRMVDTINKELLAALPDRDDPPVVVTCKTCHRGTVKPRVLGQELLLAAHQGGGAAAVEKFNELQRDFSEVGAYDFREWETNTVAEKLAEEGPPPGEEGGAELMVKEGVMDDVDVIFGLHIAAGTYVGKLEYRPKGMMAAVDDFRIVLKGKQAHGSAPWLGIDPIVTAAQVVNNLQTIVSRSLELTKAAAVVTVGSIHVGVRSNIIPEELEMLGTIRTFDPEMREKLHNRFRTIVSSTATSNGATAEIQLPYSAHYPVTFNDPDLTESMLETLERTAGKDNVELIDAITGAEDFSFFANKVPGLFLFVGGKPLDVPKDVSVSHHTPDFYINESGMKLGVRTLLNLTIDYMDKASMQ